MRGYPAIDTLSNRGGGLRNCFKLLQQSPDGATGYQLDWLYVDIQHFFPDRHRTDNRGACSNVVVVYQLVTLLIVAAISFSDLVCDRCS